MNCTTENISPLELGIIIDLEPIDYLSSVESEIKKHRQKANIPGFRPGHVPIGMIKKMYGKSIKADIINKMVAEKLDEYVKENKITYLGEPIIIEEKSIIDIENDTNQKFYFEIGVQPEIDLSQIKISNVKQYQIEATDKQVSEELEQLTKRYGSVSEPESIGESDLVIGSYLAKNEEGEPKETSILVELINDKKIKKQFVGKIATDVIIFDVKKAFEDKKQIAKILHIKEDEIDTTNTEITFTVKNISRLTPAEINNDLFVKAFPGKEIKNEDDFKASIKESIENEFVQYSERKLVDEAVKEIIEKSSFDIPSNFLKKWLLRTNEKINPENIDSEYNTMEKSIKWQLIENALVKENQIHVDMEDVKSYIREFYSGYFKSAEEVQGDDIINENLEKIVDQAIKNKDDVKKIYEMLFDKKITEAIKKLVKPKAKKISFDEFIKL